MPMISAADFPDEGVPTPGGGEGGTNQFGQILPENCMKMKIKNPFQ